MELLPENGCSTRQHRRYAYCADATFHTRDAVRCGVTENISAGGIFVRTPEPQPVGEIVTLLVPLPTQDSPPVWATAKVRWNRPAAPGAPTGMGVEFIALDADSRRAIRAIFTS
jgi:uncharacterized protein (TIGR02266 family)